MQEKDSAGNETGRPPPLPPEHRRHAVRDDEPRERLNHELRLGEAGTLPAAAEGCAFVVKDEARSDVLKVLIPARRTSTT